MAYNIFMGLLIFYFFESRLVHFNWNVCRDQTETQTINRNSPFAYNNAVSYNKLILGNCPRCKNDLYRWRVA